MCLDYHQEHHWLQVKLFVNKGLVAFGRYTAFSLDAVDAGGHGVYDILCGPPARLFWFTPLNGVYGVVHVYSIYECELVLICIGLLVSVESHLVLVSFYMMHCSCGLRKRD